MIARSLTMWVLAANLLQAGAAADLAPDIIVEGVSILLALEGPENPAPLPVPVVRNPGLFPLALAGHPRALADRHGALPSVVDGNMLHHVAKNPLASQEFFESDVHKVGLLAKNPVCGTNRFVAPW